MTRLAAGVLAGAVLGAAYGVARSWGEPKAFLVFMSVLGRMSQGIINGVLSSWVAKPGAPLWRVAGLSTVIGLGLGAIAGAADGNWSSTLPFGAAIGLGCGLAAGRIKS
jgi:hypothetical protein